MPRGVPKSKNPELYGGKAKKTVKKTKAATETNVNTDTLQAVNVPFNMVDLGPPNPRYEAIEDVDRIIKVLRNFNSLRTEGGIAPDIFTRIALPLVERLDERISEAFPATTYEVTEKAVVSQETTTFDSEDDDEPDVVEQLKPVVRFQPEA